MHKFYYSFYWFNGIGKNVQNWETKSRENMIMGEQQQKKEFRIIF